MGSESIVERPVARRASPHRRWLPALIVSICVLFTFVGLGKVVLSKGLLQNERFLDLVDPLKTVPHEAPKASAEVPDIDIADNSTDFDDFHILDKRQSTTYISSGISWNGIRTRQNFNDFARDADLLNLFLVGLDFMQGLSQNNQQSYFQIAGIHGAPYVPWNNVDGPNRQSGYCTHASILFPTWHRPYLATIEQIVGNIMRNLANQYPAGATRSRMQAAATRFRLPYWDWASDARVPAIIANQPNVRVQKPAGFVNIRNPLYSYSFHPFSPNFFPYPPFNGWGRTLRQPDGNSNSNPTEMNRQLVANQGSLRNRVFNLLNFQTRFNVFSNKAWNGGNSGNQDSIESVHDLIHGVVGGRGHMAVVDTSAMDPIFWLHHCNVDRIIAMWQAINPTSWTTGQRAIFGTRTNQAGQIEDSTTALTPFRRYPNTFWTSNTARDIRRFYYTYPELADASSVDVNTLRTRVRGRVQALYGGNAPQNQLRGATKRSYGSAHDASRLAKGGKYHEWTANVRINKYLAGGPYLINFFIGEPTKGVQWTEDPNFIGSYYLFSKNGTCHGCQEDAFVTGSVPLTNTLIGCAQDGNIADLEPKSVTPYLAKKLNWRVYLPDGSYLNPGQVKSLKVSVTAASVSIPKGPEQGPFVSTWTTYFDITNKKPGGLCYGDEA